MSRSSSKITTFSTPTRGKLCRRWKTLCHKVTIVQKVEKTNLATIGTCWTVLSPNKYRTKHPSKSSRLAIRSSFHLKLHRGKLCRNQESKSLTSPWSWQETRSSLLTISHLNWGLNHQKLKWALFRILNLRLKMMETVRLMPWAHRSWRLNRLAYRIAKLRHKLATSCHFLRIRVEKCWTSSHRLQTTATSS